jgi:surface-anchored protein
MLRRASSFVGVTLLPWLLSCEAPRESSYASDGSAGDVASGEGGAPTTGAGAAGAPSAAAGAEAEGGAQAEGGAAGGGEAGGEAPLAGAPAAGAGGGDGDEDCELTYDNGHGDLFVGFDGGLQLSVRSTFGGPPPEWLAETSRVCVVVPAASRALVESMGGAPESSDYAFLGVRGGDPFWLLPATPRAEMPWFGASTEDVPSGQYDGDEVRVAIASVEKPERGQVAVWSTSTFGPPTALFSTVTGALTHSLPVGAHLHFNWAFTVAGVYTLTFTVQGEQGGSSDLSPPSPLRFVVRR